MSRSKRNARPWDEATAASSASVCTSGGTFDHDIFQLTKLRSAPSEEVVKIAHMKPKGWISPVKMLAAREGNYFRKSRFSAADSCHVLSRYLPVNGPYLVDQMDSRAYVSQFSADGSILVAGYQGSNVKIYNMENGWKVQKTILAKSLRWTITDTSLSPDQRFLVYSSMSPVVHIVKVGSAVKESHANVTEIHEGLDFSGDDDDEDDMLGIFAVKFSTDGREIVAASNDNSIYVYDLLTNKRTLRILAHEDDVNTVSFADESGHLIYSGSDDGLCKVWDRRCLNVRGQPAGTLVGHLEGITFIDSRGDGRHFISNGKDQTIKLWDIRKMSSYSEPSVTMRRRCEWDYRWMSYPSKLGQMRHPNDQSLATYKGHSVLRTLIRCHFSPEFSTGQKYIYTGSNDGAVYVYDLVTGDVVAILDHHETTVRDCCWHPYLPVIISSAWDGMIIRCEFPGRDENPTPLRHRSRRRRRFF